MANSGKTELEATAARTLAEARTNPTPETRQAAIEASRALSLWIATNEPNNRPGPLKSRGNLAGKRQYREHLARHNIIIK